MNNTEENLAAPEEGSTAARSRLHRLVRRFVRLKEPPYGLDADLGTQWWADRHRPLADKHQPYTVVQVGADKDPNDYREIDAEMRLLFTDQCEYYVVCRDCRSIYGHMQWSGSTRGPRNWREEAEVERVRHQREKGWCEFCDPIFGSGGWML